MKKIVALKLLTYQLLSSPAQRQVKLLIAGVCMIFLASTSYAQVIEGIDYSDRKNVDKTFDMAGTDNFGQRFPSESLTITDPATGVQIIALTTSRHNSSKIYQDHPNWTADGKYIVFSSDRNTTAGGNITFAGSTPVRKTKQFYAISMDNHEIVQITTGAGVSDILLGHKKNVAFRFRDNQVIELNLGSLLSD